MVMVVWMVYGDKLLFLGQGNSADKPKRSAIVKGLTSAAKAGSEKTSDRSPASPLKDQRPGSYALKLSATLNQRGR